MARLLRVAVPGVLGVGVAVAAWSTWWLVNDISRNRVSRPRPIEHRRVVPIYYDGTPIRSGVR